MLLIYEGILTVPLLVQNFDAKLPEIKALFANQLDPIRASEHT
jgi:hypothetical protein